MLWYRLVPWFCLQILSGLGHLTVQLQIRNDALPRNGMKMRRESEAIQPCCYSAAALHKNSSLIFNSGVGTWLKKSAFQNNLLLFFKDGDGFRIQPPSTLVSGLSEKWCRNATDPSPGGPLHSHISTPSWEWGGIHHRAREENLLMREVFGLPRQQAAAA